MKPGTGGTIWDSNKPEEELSEFELLLRKYDYNFNRGDVIKGIVVGYESNGLLIDVGAKTNAFVPPREVAPEKVDKLQDYIEIGEERDFYILKEEDDDGQITLSLKRVALAYSWSKLEELKNEDAVVECEVMSVVKGGILVDVMGLRGFVPASHLRVRSSDAMVGQVLPLKILSIEPKKNNLIMSHRKVVSEQQAEQRKDTFEKLEVGESVMGEVVRLADFGAFIDIGGIDGLLPLSQMSWRWVDHPSDILSVGDRIKVEVIGIDYEKQRVSLSLKSQQPDPWEEISKMYSVGQKLPGKVTRIKHFGAFVEVYPGVEALLPSKEVIEYEKDNNTKLSLGQEITTTIIRFVPEDRRMSLSYTGQLDEDEELPPPPMD
ncbi:MAG: S1 RNA-binding domain-containing protein [Cyanobacteriota bacterium]